MNKQPLFSIVTVCFNSEQTIERTIKSVLQQKFLDYEYLIIDGASKDGTLDIIKKYEPLFEGRMEWQSEPDKGIYDAFNKGCKRAQGTYVWIVNSDDFMESNALAELAEIIGGLDQDKLPVISGVANYVAKDGLTVLRKSKASENVIDWAYKHDSIGVFHPATLVPKEVYEKYGYFDDRYTIIGDIDWFQRAYKSGTNFKFVDISITNMSEGGISDSASIAKRLPDRRLLAQKKYRTKIEQYYRIASWLARLIKNKYVTKIKLIFH